MTTVRKYSQGKLAVQASWAHHHLVSDVSAALGGDDLGPDPHDLLNAALAACTSITVQMVAKRKQWPLEDVLVQIKFVETPGLYGITREVTLIGPALTDEQRQSLMAIANKCPIHRILLGEIRINTVEIPASA